MPANDDDTVSVHSTVSNSDFNRFNLSDTFKTNIFSQIQDSEESLPRWGEDQEEDDTGRPRQRSKAAAGATQSANAGGSSSAGAATMTRNNATGLSHEEEIEDTSDVVTPMATRKDFNPLDKVSTAERTDDKLRPNMLRRLTTRLRRTVSAQQKG
jgi:hypothetical protein